MLKKTLFRLKSRLPFKNNFLTSISRRKNVETVYLHLCTIYMFRDVGHKNAF